MTAALQIGAKRRGPAGGTLQLVAATFLVAGTIVVSGLLDSAYWHHNFLLVNLFVAVAVLQNMMLADAGQVSFGQGAIFGLAAYTVGIAAAIHGHALWASLFVGVLFALLLGLAFALPSLRVQGYYLGFVSLSAAVVFPELLVALDSITKGINGITIKPTALSQPIAGKLTPLSLMVLAFVCVTIAAHHYLRGTALGRRMRVAARSPEAAQTLGISPGHMRFLAFLLAALGTGVAGALYTPLIGFVSPYAFRVELSVYFFFAVIVGGSGRVLGPVIGAWILYLIPNVLLVDLADYRLLGYGIAALFIMLVFPDGVVGTLERFFRRPAVAAGNLAAAIALVRKESVAEVAASAAQKRNPVAIDVRGATKRFGNVAALSDIDLTVQHGTIHGIVGPNGSGKTTLINAFSGLIRLDAGEIRINGTAAGRLAPHRIPGLGVSRTFQTPRVFDDMSVWDNLEIGAGGAVSGRRSAVLAALEPVRVEWQAGSPAAFQHAQRRLLEVLRAAVTEADIILLDEPAAGLSPDERMDLAEFLTFMRDHFGKTIVLVDHDLSLVWRVADRITVLDAGISVTDGAPARIRNDPKVQALFTGRPNA